jgi:hypothetical protein
MRSSKEFQSPKIDPKIALGLITGVSGVSVLANTTASQAAVPSDVTTAVTDINGTFGAISGVAAAAMAVALTVLGIWFGIGYGKKIMSKG